MTNNLDVCLILGSTSPLKMWRREIRSILDEGYNIPLILVPRHSDKPTNDPANDNLLSKPMTFISKLIHREWSILIDTERFVARKIKPETVFEEERRHEKTRKDIFECEPRLNKSKVVSFEPERNEGISYDFPDEIVSKVTETSDVAILIGYHKILRGNILEKPKHGVLSFHAGDMRKYRGRPGQFFQWINGEDSIAITLQRLENDIDGGKEILCERIDISEAKSPDEVLYRTLVAYGDLASQGLRRLEDPSFTPETPELGELTYEYEGDNIKNVLKHLKRTIKRRY